MYYPLYTKSTIIQLKNREMGQKIYKKKDLTIYYVDPNVDPHIYADFLGNHNYADLYGLEAKPI